MPFVLGSRRLRHRQLGIGSNEDALRLIGRTMQARRFEELCGSTMRRFPQLKPWLAAHPLKVLEHVDDWERILAIPRLSLLHRCTCKGSAISNIDTKRG